MRDQMKERENERSDQGKEKMKEGEVRSREIEQEGERSDQGEEEMRE